MIAENWLQLDSSKGIDCFSADNRVNESIGRHFTKAIDSYDGAARLQRLSAQKLLLDNTALVKGDVLDLGSGTGLNTVKLLSINNEGTTFACDLCYQMVQKTQQRVAMTASAQQNDRFVCLQGDVNDLPFADNRFDLIYSNLMLQWLDPLVPALNQIKRVLKPQGQLVFTTLLQGTLQEYQQAWAAVDNDNHINQFLTKEQLVSALKQAGLEFEIEQQTVSLDYPQVTDLARELKKLGANYVKSRKNQGLTGRGKWQAVASEYERLRQSNGLLPASYQVAYIRAKVAS